VWPARNRSVYEMVIICAPLNALFRDGLDVMIKVISYKDEGVNEVNILKYLSSEPVVSEANNPSVPLLEILRHDNWVFSIQPRWSSSVKPEFQNVSDGLSFCIQVTQVMPFYSTYFTPGVDRATGRRISAPPSHRPPGINIFRLLCYF
jgi:hypothetical protein